MSDKDGVEFVGQLNWYECYEWSVFGVWKKDHQLFSAFDSGCSCNGPWDNGASRNPATLDEIRQYARIRSDWEGRDATEEFIRDIEAAVA